MAAKKPISKKSPKSRVNLWHKVRHNPRFNLYAVIVVVAVLALAGYYAYRSRAAFGPGSIAASTLSLSGGAKTVSDSNTTSGSAVQFTSNSSGTGGNYNWGGDWVNDTGNNAFPSTSKTFPTPQGDPCGNAGNMSLGYGFPCASTTGPKAGHCASFTPWPYGNHLDASVVAEHGGSTFDCYNFSTWLEVQVSGVTITNFKFINTDPNRNEQSGLMSIVGTVKNVEISNCEFDGQNVQNGVITEPNAFVKNSISYEGDDTTVTDHSAPGVTVKYCNIHNTSWGMQPGSDWVIEHNYVHDILLEPPACQLDNCDHHNAIPFQGARNAVIWHNTVSMKGVAYSTDSTVGEVEGAAYNTFLVGSRLICGISSCTKIDGGHNPGWHVLNNRMSYDQGTGGNYAYPNTDTTGVYSGNFDDGFTPAKNIDAQVQCNNPNINCQ